MNKPDTLSIIASALTFLTLTPVISRAAPAAPVPGYELE
jgi:hypothetical protein